MQHWKKNLRLVVSLVVLLGLAAVLSPSGLRALVQADSSQHLSTEVHAGPTGAEDWIATPEAQFRSQNNLCPEGFECLELCVGGEGTGTFECWPANQW